MSLGAILFEAILAVLVTFMVAGGDFMYEMCLFKIGVSLSFEISNRFGGKGSPPGSLLVAKVRN